MLRVGTGGGRGVGVPMAGAGRAAWLRVGWRGAGARGARVGRAACVRLATLTGALLTGAGGAAGGAGGREPSRQALNMVSRVSNRRLNCIQSMSAAGQSRNGIPRRVILSSERMCAHLFMAMDIGHRQ